MPSIALGDIRIDRLIDLPSPTTVPAGTLFYAWDSLQYFLCVLSDGVNTRAWTEIGGSQATNLDLYVSPSGNDDNPGTQALPLLTVEEAIHRASHVGWTGYCHVNLAAGTYTLPANAIFAPSGAGGVGAEPLCVIGALEDSGLGTRTVGASSAGSGSTFATTTDTAGGLVANAWRGWFLRYTSGTQSGKQYLISGNTVGGQWNLVGTQAAPANGDTFVVERPSSVIQSTNNIISVTGSAAPMVGFYRVRFDGQSAAGSSFVVRGSQVYHSACWFQNFLQVAPNFQATIYTMFAPVSNNSRTVFPSLGQTQTVGSFFTTGVANATVNLQRNSSIDFQQCLISGYNVTLANGGYMQAALSYFVGTAAVRGANGADVQLAQCRFDTVTAITGDYANGAIVLDHGAHGLVQLVDVSNCTGVALAVTGGSVCRCISLTGSGNAGVPVQVLRGSGLVKCSGNSVTGAAAGSDVQVGATAAASAWAAVNAGPIYDNTAVGTNQFCYTSN